MSYVSLVSLTQAEFNALKTAGTALDRPVAFFITDAAAGAPNIIFGRQGQTATVAQSSGAVAAGAAAGVVLNNFAATAAPTAANDNTQGYAVGSRWVDTTGDESYICVDAATGAAVWSKTTVGTIAEVSGLQAALDLKAPLASPALTGVPTAPTATAQTNTTQVATTAFVQTEIAADLATVAPLMDGVAAVGISTKMARQDHVHPFDTGRAASAHTHAEADVTGLTADLAAKQATLVSGTNIKTVNGVSVVGAGNVSVAADLPGGAATTVTNEGMVTTGSPSIDTTTVPGETIITFTATGSFTPPNGVTTIPRILGVAGGGAGGKDHAGGGGGGAGGVGGNSTPASSAGAGDGTSGSGGAGIDSDISGATVGYGGGGAGGRWANGPLGTATHGGGVGEGATAASNQNGITNRGGGGGGGGDGGKAGGNGGSGVLIIRFPTQTRSYQALQAFANDSAAATGGILTGQFYRDSSTGAVRQRVS